MNNTHGGFVTTNYRRGPADSYPGSKITPFPPTREVAVSDAYPQTDETADTCMTPARRVLAEKATVLAVPTWFKANKLTSKQRIGHQNYRPTLHGPSGIPDQQCSK